MIVCAYIALSLLLFNSLIYIIGEIVNLCNSSFYKLNHFAFVYRIITIVLSVLGIIGVATK